MNNTQSNWNLKTIYKSDDDPQIIIDQKVSANQVNDFQKKWIGNSEYLKNAKVLKSALDEYEKIFEVYGTNDKEYYYFNLRSHLDQNHSTIKARYNKAHELSQNLLNTIQFFTINISKIPNSNQHLLLNSPLLKNYKHFLEKLFSLGKYTLSDSEERILNLKVSTSYGNWVKMTSSFLSREGREVINEEGKNVCVNFSEITNLMNSGNKKTRDSAATAFNEILLTYSDIAEHELNSVLDNKKVDDFLRGSERPDLLRHINDDIDTKVVDSLTESLTSKFDISKRYYQLKAKILGVDKLEFHERNVEIGTSLKRYSPSEAFEIISKAITKLDPEFSDILESLIKNGQIDIFPKNGKVEGACCFSNLITQPAYIILNFNGSINSLLTAAHEIGHAINSELTKRHQNSLNFGSPTSTAEVASIFFEDFVLQEIFVQEDPKDILPLIMMKLNEDISTSFRQIAFYNFEKELHEEYRRTGYLSKEIIGKLFLKHVSSYLGNSVEMSRGSENWWVYVNHFRYYFYVYSYASGIMISKYLQSKVKENPEFIQKVKAFLSTGLSESPSETFKKLGVSIEDKNFWLTGAGEIESLLNTAEKIFRDSQK